MPNLTLLREELEQTVSKREGLREKHKNAKVMPDDAKAEDHQLHERAQKIRKAIDEEMQKQRDHDFAELHDFIDAPDYKVQKPINDDDLGRKELQKAGWEVKGGMVVAPTSTGKPVEMYEENVLFGAMPSDDPEAYEFFKQTRGAFQPEYRAAYAKYIRSAAKMRSESMAFAQLSQEEQKALQEGVDAEGGYLVPPDIQAEILVRLPQMSVMRQLARIVNTSRDRIVFPAVAPHATSGSIYSSGFVGGWDVETPAFSDVDPTFQRFEIGIKKARSATKLSNDFIADAAANVLAFMAQNGAENLALVEDNGFVAGAGTGLVPLGILESGAQTVDVEGTTSDTVDNSTSDTGSAPKLINLTYQVPSQYAGRGAWLMRRAIEGQIRQLVDANGRYMWPDLSGSAFAATPRTLMGYPVFNSEFVEDDGTDANRVVVFGDISNYIIAQRSQISTVVLRERFADSDQTGIILTERVGGGMWNTDAIRLGIV